MTPSRIEVINVRRAFTLFFCFRTQSSASRSLHSTTLAPGSVVGVHSTHLSFDARGSMVSGQQDHSYLVNGSSLNGRGNVPRQANTTPASGRPVLLLLSSFERQPFAGIARSHSRAA